jgi:hypothetical protein
MNEKSTTETHPVLGSSGGGSNEHIEPYSNEGLEPGAMEAANQGQSREFLALYSIAISMRRMADDVQEIRHGMSFICERWKR